MTERDSLRPIERRQEADINLLFRTLADAIRNATADSDGDMPVSLLDRDAILRAVDAGLAVIWGEYSGDPNGAMRTRGTRPALARFEPLDRAVRELRRAMPANLREW